MQTYFESLFTRCNVSDSKHSLLGRVVQQPFLAHVPRYAGRLTLTDCTKEPIHPVIPSTSTGSVCKDFTRTGDVSSECKPR